VYAASKGAGEMKSAAARATGSRARRARYTKHTASPRVVMITYIGSQNYTTWTQPVPMHCDPGQADLQFRSTTSKTR
jgi:hypothetical protein